MNSDSFLIEKYSRAYYVKHLIDLYVEFPDSRDRIRAILLDEFPNAKDLKKAAYRHLYTQPNIDLKGRK